MEKVNLLRKVFEGEYEPISHFITNRSQKYIALYNQSSEEQTFFMSIIPKEYHEAGRLEGLGTIRRFLTIDIPLIMPQIKYIFITTFIGSVQNFARTHILRSTVVTTPVQNMYEMMTAGDYGMSSAYATLIFIFLFAAIATNFKMQKKGAMGDDL